MGTCLGAPDEMRPLCNHGLPLGVGGMRLACEDELRRARDQGVEFILSKPFTDAELRQGILNAIGPPPGAAAAPPPAVPTAAPTQVAKLSSEIRPVAKQFQHIALSAGYLSRIALFGMRRDQARETFPLLAQRYVFDHP